MKSSDNFLRSYWYKFNEYEILDSTYIIPKKSAKIEVYDPLVQNENFRKDKKNEIFTDLIKIHEAKIEDDKKKLALLFSKNWGLTGLLMHCCNKFQTAPVFGSIDFTGADIEDRKIEKKIKQNKKTFIINSEDLKSYDTKKKQIFI